MAQKKLSKAEAAKEARAAQKARRVQNIVILVVCWFFLLLSFILAKKDYMLLNWIYTGLCFILGYGAYLLPISFAAALLLVILNKRDVNAKIISIFVLNILITSLAHVLFSGQTAPADLGETGIALASGGYIAGLFAYIFIKIVSPFGAFVLLSIFIAWMVFILFNLNALTLFSSLGHWIDTQRVQAALRRRERLAEEEGREDASDDAFETAATEDPLAAEETENAVERPVTLDDRVPQLPFFDESDYDDSEPGTVVFAKKETAADETEPSGFEPGETGEVETSEALSLETGGDDAPWAKPPKPYPYPPLDLLITDFGANRTTDEAEETKRNKKLLIDTLLSFGIEAQLIGITRGSTVTRYEIKLREGTKQNKLTGLAGDIALALGAQGVRIAPVPEKLAMGVEVPNKIVNMVYLRDIITSDLFKSSKSPVTFAIGQDIGGAPMVGDIAKLPHMLVAGTTGSGKSVCINALLISLLYKSSPEAVKLIMIDPKMIELGVYNGIPHLLIPVVTDPKKAAGALQWAVAEMMRRYKLLAEAAVKDIAAYNQYVQRGGEGEVLPQIVIVIDELADLMLTAASEVEAAICRIAQMARAAGMHLIIATQRPSRDVITGLMKANIPSRIAFAVASQIDSRIILDTMGAEQLIGKGDMLFNPIGITKPIRIQGCFVSTEEVEKVINYIKKYTEVSYDQDVMDQIDTVVAKSEKKSPDALAEDDGNRDDLFDDALAVVMETKQASASMLQRRIKIGYARASRLIDQLAEAGFIGPSEGAKPRQILISQAEYQEMRLRQKGE